MAVDPRLRTKDGILRAANRIGCDVRALQAVLQVETRGYGFLSDGRPVILFERHVFSRITDRRFDAVAPDISNPAAGGYVNPAGEWSRMYRAVQLDPEAALHAASWGIGQIMGHNWRACGEKSIHGFILAMHHNEDAQLMLMAEFIVREGLADALAKHDWPAFARGYNGRAYARNKYDERLASAYARQVPA